jgi:hypothetical protein
VHSVLSRSDQADLAHHRVPGLVPELPGHVAIIAPGLPLGLDDDAGHHLRHVDLANPLEEHHQRLRASVEVGIIEERLGVHPLVVQVLKPLVAARDGVVDVGSA